MNHDTCCGANLFFYYVRIPTLGPHAPTSQLAPVLRRRVALRASPVLVLPRGTGPHTSGGAYGCPPRPSRERGSTARHSFPTLLRARRRPSPSSQLALLRCATCATWFLGLSPPVSSSHLHLARWTRLNCSIHDVDGAFTPTRPSTVAFHLANPCRCSTNLSSSELQV